MKHNFYRYAIETDPIYIQLLKNFSYYALDGTT